MPLSNNSWDERIKRAQELAQSLEATSELLGFYASLLRTQKEIYEAWRSRRDWLPSGVLEDDLVVLRDYFPLLLKTVEAKGSESLVQQAQQLKESSPAVLDELLLNYWHTRSDSQFFAKAFLQPYAQWIVDSDGRILDQTAPRDEKRCPFCLGNPQVSYLSLVDQSAQSGGRNLICATCLSSWTSRRLLCVACGEERPDQLALYRSEELEHVRIEVCESCKSYIKGVDLTRLGFAVPLVDDVATAALDLWAMEKGYRKIEMNLVGV